jgi:hypothetical protein
VDGNLLQLLKENFCTGPGRETWRFKLVIAYNPSGFPAGSYFLLAQGSLSAHGGDEMLISNNKINYQVYLLIHRKLYPVSAWNTGPWSEAHHLLPSDAAIKRTLLPPSHMSSWCCLSAEAVVLNFAVLLYWNAGALICEAIWDKNLNISVCIPRNYMHSLNCMRISWIQRILGRMYLFLSTYIYKEAM